MKRQIPVATDKHCYVLCVYHYKSSIHKEMLYGNKKQKRQLYKGNALRAFEREDINRQMEVDNELEDEP